MIQVRGDSRDSVWRAEGEGGRTGAEEGMRTQRAAQCRGLGDHLTMIMVGDDHPRQSCPGSRHDLGHSTTNDSR